ncbi:NACHT N-terminal Helical domain 1-containing protein [Streptomyces chartreusis]|uniref:NACHT N-terminal Helical domain 1-containing protein n=1 Tax=Streptomyces chartreusis TaxID=1969 RepID=UPI0036602AAF
MTGTTPLFRHEGTQGEAAWIRRSSARKSRPVRVGPLAYFRGEKRKLGDKGLRRLVRELVERAARETGAAAATARAAEREAPMDEAELEAFAWALLRTPPPRRHLPRAAHSAARR